MVFIMITHSGIILGREIARFSRFFMRSRVQITQMSKISLARNSNGLYKKIRRKSAKDDQLRYVRVLTPPFCFIRIASVSTEHF